MAQANRSKATFLFTLIPTKRDYQQAISETADFEKKIVVK
jgi:hypothetical protein